ncbi:hypothetical protein KO361_05680 [Candidatus Woesearchaeota archaeon]|nr:hypothetical protein [Candidatus Woesearchaeota archaeon]
MEEKSLFIKLEKYKEVNDLFHRIERTKEQTRQKIELMKKLMIKEKSLLEDFEESLNRADTYMEDARRLLDKE